MFEILYFYLVMRQALYHRGYTINIMLIVYLDKCSKSKKNVDAHYSVIL